ncbi:hypothetical protein [Micromonospora sp. KC213]|uniref:hypothetical protein n=1 Tax=Micromonospora sp. KC213 TaxID=2530378 RepID=UPI0010464DFF|nr:hypothetical protein [Micromonospora sp. KC213]TDC43863.1 hypothetical protein E1166_02415 [Micromonospora sp. KC213]
MELRRAGYRLLRGQGVEVELRAALILAVDADLRLATRGKADATRIARDATRATWRYAPRPELHVTAAEHAELVALTAQAAAALGDETSQQIAAWFASSRSDE